MKTTGIKQLISLGIAICLIGCVAPVSAAPLGFTLTKYMERANQPTALWAKKKHPRREKRSRKESKLSTKQSSKKKKSQEDQDQQKQNSTY